MAKKRTDVMQDDVIVVLYLVVIVGVLFALGTTMA